MEDKKKNGWGFLKNKETMITIIAVGIFLLILVIPLDKKMKEKDQSQLSIQTTDNHYGQEERLKEEQLERRLEEMLMKMEGVGKAEVMISYSDKTDLKKNNSESLIFGAAADLEKEKSEARSVEGILVLCEGGDRSEVVFLVSETIQALFPLEPHKIKVTKLSQSL